MSLPIQAPRLPTEPFPLPPPRDTRPADLPDSRRPGEPYGTDENGFPKDEARLLREFQATLAQASATGDLSLLDGVDNFRQTLTPELQAEYDAQLAALRNDPRIEFEYQPGVEPNPDPALEDMTLRGILAATFGNPELMDRVIDGAVAANDDYNGGPEGDGHMVIRFYDGNAVTDDGDEALGWAMSGAGHIRINANYMVEALSKGDSVPQHEFSHFMNYYGQPGSIGTFPAGFPFEQQMLSELEAAGFEVNGETWPDLQNRFRQYPERLAQEHPGIYRMMVEYAGYDPLTQASSPPVRLDGTGDVASAAATLDRYFAQVSGGDDYVTAEDLRQLLDSPDFSLPADVRAAAAYLLSSPTARHLVDTASNCDVGVDGFISQSDLQATAGLASSSDYAYLLLDTAAGKDGRDGFISREDVAAALSDPGVSPEIREQIERIVADNPQLALPRILGGGIHYG